MAAHPQQLPRFPTMDPLAPLGTDELSTLLRAASSDKVSTSETGSHSITGNQDEAALRRPRPASDTPWKLLIVDDDRSVHAVTRMVLHDFTYKSRGLLILSEYSAEAAQRTLSRHPDIAVVLLDVIMETDSAGLDLVRHIRDDLDNHLIRIILRTGQPGAAPEHLVVGTYDINDYRDKVELTAQKLLTAVTTALRGYDDLLTIHTLSASNELLANEIGMRKRELEAASEALRRSEALLAEAQRIAAVGSFEWNLVDGTITWSDELLRILGMSRENLGADLEPLRKATAPEDRAAVDAALTEVLADRDSYVLEHRIVRPDGTLRHVRQQGELHCDAAGAPARLVGIVQDVTALYRSEARIRQLSSAIEQTADAVTIVRADGTIEYVNAAFSTMTGYPSEEAVGRTTQFLGSEKQGGVYYEHLWRRVREGRNVSDVMLNRRKDGSLYHESQTITPQRDASGDITHFIVTGRNVSEWMHVREQMEHMAHHDALTGLPNRALLADRLRQAIARAKRQDLRVAVAFLDLDRFKVINDTLGHESGDRLLKDTASRLLACVREGDTVARLGGDEFAIVLNDLSSSQDVVPVVKKIIAAMQTPISIDNRDLFVTTSIGISIFPEDGTDGPSLLKHADSAMYRAKSQGRDTYRFYEASNDAAEVARLDLETSLRQSVRNRDLFLVYQPQIDITTGDTLCVEALLRWRRHDGEIVPPRDFLPLLEETGMVTEICDWALETACTELRKVHGAGVTHCRVAINISRHQFRDRTFAERLAELLCRTGLQARSLELEIGEGILAENVGGSIATLNSLRDLGVRLTINDFGTGRSSLHNLGRFSVHAIKLDSALLAEGTTTKQGRSVVDAIVSLAQTIGLEAIACGVETDEQARLVTGAGCRIIQGDLISPPREIAELIELETSRSRQGTAVSP